MEIMKTMITMKKTLFLFVSALMMLTGCYPDYVRDFDDGTGIYTAYQYDLRSFVMGENESFDFTVALGGTISNDKDRKVKVVIDNSLLTSDLAQIAPEKKYDSFTALDAILGKGSFGIICQKYVTDEVKAAGISVLTPLPESYFKINDLSSMTIKKGRHTAVATVKATDFIKEDPNVFAPYYALGFRIESADADVLEPESSFEVIVVKCENKFFGQWSHSGADYSQSDDKVFTLKTKDHNSVVLTGSAATGPLVLSFNEDCTIDVASADGSVSVSAIAGEPSMHNNAKLLQEREISLNFTYTSGADIKEFRETLKFRSRVRDGVLESQDENPENYK